MNIISDNRCHIQINECGEFELSIASISGKFNPIILSTHDSIKLEGYPIYFWEYDTTSIEIEEFITILNQHFGHVIFLYNSFLKRVEYTTQIEQMTSNFKNIIEFGSTNGPPFLFVRAEHLNTPMRYCNELKNENYPAIVNIVSITLNTFATDYPFVLGGVSTKINSQQLKSINLRITDEDDNDIRFISPILWSFNLSKIQFDEL
jgi:hypothetical protein